ncbi:MAG TPA: rRNA maturation RNase YbeY [Paludibacteraceae bacterium]|nr:rRNA maturation RNase YbeY [Paludibacteraceae bacterium]HOH74432.1 rRNA maturation RNase YbeY [Paludibacteraceae bacterium]HOR40243.1 rRNA maturation RNase YbeY [Paludibacteraceae bacterium]HOU26526.1 rRNA maturation RNase YbeY [Paludibacteraceae bacterium]HPL93797.1 rRNA maturation RNase YbeY [Paludibacteraceae bacterium]
MAVHFIFDDTKTLRLKKRMIAEWIKNVASGYGKSIGEISYIFCSDNKILAINNEYLQHDYYTDIITFDYTEEQKIAGDIFISVDTVSSNAHIYTNTFSDEMARILIHGILHLCGIKDKTQQEEQNMRKAEDKALALLKEKILR